MKRRTPMRKIISKIVVLMLGLSLGAGVSVSLMNRHNALKVHAADTTVSKTSFDAVSGDLDSNISFEAQKGDAATAPAINNSVIRVYQNGGLFLVTPKNSSTIKSITLGSAMATTVQVKIGDGSYSSNYSISANGSHTEDNLSATSTVTFKCTGTDKNSRLYVNSLSVTYTSNSSGGGDTTNYTVSFNMQGHGTQVVSQNIVSGGKVTEPTAPTADGYTFGGWYKEAACSTAWNFSTDTVSAATILYAKWTANSSPSSGSYTLVTSVSSLANNDSVVIATVGSSGPSKGVTGMNSNNKDATATTTESEWVKYAVTLSGTGFTLADGSNSIYFAAKTIKYGTASVLNVTVDGYICLNDSATTILYEQSTYIRPYADKAGTEGYVPFAVYKVESESIDPSLETLTIKANGSEPDSASMNFSVGTVLFYAYDESDVQVSGCEWSISDSSIATLQMNGNNVPYVTFVKGGTVTITASKTGYNAGEFSLTINIGELQSIVVSGSMTNTTYYVGESWNSAGLIATASYSYGYSYNASNDVLWTFDPSQPALNVTSVVATATLEQISGDSASQIVTVSRPNPIQAIYTKSSGDSVDVYGYYVGFLDGTGPVIMDGEYGIVAFNRSADVTNYVEGETILHVTGSVSIYKGLYEIGSPNISEASGDFDTPESPVIYATNGNETAEYASRLTTLSGTPSLVSGNFDTAGSVDIKLSFAIGLKTVQVFYKKAAQTADSDAFAAVKAAVTNSEEITIKGFTSWYEGFQVQMNGYVPAVETYTAEDFSQDLLDQTDLVCANYNNGDDNHDAIEAIWTNLASNGKYPSLPSAQKTLLADAERNESGTVIERAMARYDYLTGKYELSNFINGRTPISFARNTNFVSGNVSTNTLITLLVIVSLTSITSIGVLLAIKRKREITK